MSGHYPFSGKTNRLAVFAFFEKNQMSLALQERYYRWWHEWAKAFVINDPDLRASKAVEFAHFPYGQHAHGSFHLHDYQWSTPLVDLGMFVETTILPKLSDKAQHELEEAHAKMLATLLSERDQEPRPEPPEVGRYRHV
ncbi:MAG: hypothetical protein ACYCVY_05295 [Acidiferrobacteraceae bacterium]